jgi:hypothetical protein
MLHVGFDYFLLDGALFGDIDRKYNAITRLRVVSFKTSCGLL